MAHAAALDGCDRDCGKSGKMSAMPGQLFIRGSVVIPEAELRWRFSRSSGPGGQSVNTTDSRVELVFDIAGTKALPPALIERALARLGDRVVDGAVVIAASEF